MSVALLARLTCDGEGCNATADVLSDPAYSVRCAPLPDGWTHDDGHRWDSRDSGRSYRPQRDLCPSCTARRKETR